MPTTLASPTRFDAKPIEELSVGWLMVIVDSTIVNVALPPIRRELAGTISDLQWVVDAYTITFAALLLPAGWVTASARRGVPGRPGGVRRRVDGLRARPVAGAAMLGTRIGGLGLLALLGGHVPYAALVVPMVASGFGISFSVVAATTVVVDRALAGRVGIASGALTASRQVGGALGTAMLGAFLAAAGGRPEGARVALLEARWDTWWRWAWRWP